MATTTTRRRRLHRDAPPATGTDTGITTRDGVGSEAAPAAAPRRAVEDRFGGINWGAAFFGWLVAVGMAAILVAIVSGAGAALGFTEATNAQASDHAQTIGIVGGALLVAIVLVAWYCGGYVAGRMSRFDGGRQGMAVWILGLLAAAASAVAAAIAGPDGNVFEQLGLPRVPVDEGSVATAGLIALAAALIVSLLAAIAGGIAGRRYHRRVDRAALDA